MPDGGGSTQHTAGSAELLAIVALSIVREPPLLNTPPQACEMVHTRNPMKCALMRLCRMPVATVGAAAWRQRVPL